MSCQFRIMDFNYLFQDDVDLTPSSEDAEFPASNLRNQSRAYPWRTTGVDEESLVIDLKTIEEIDSAVIFFDPTVGIKLSEGADVRIQANATNVWDSPAVDQAMTIDEDNGVISHFFSTDQSYRYWRLFIDDPVSGYTYLEIPKLMLTKATQLTQGPKQGFGMKLSDQTKNQRTEYGHEFSDVYPSLKALDFSFEAITDADRETLKQVFERVGSVRCIAVSLDSEEDIFDKDTFLIYGKIRGDFQAKHSVFSYFDSGLTLEEVI